MEENKGKGKLIGIIVAVVAVLAVGIGAFAFAGQNKAAFKKLKGTPDEIVTAALSNTQQKVLKEQADMKHKLGMDQMDKIHENEATELNFNLGLQSISGIDDADIINAYIKDAGLSGTFQSTKDGKKANGNVKVTQSGIELVGASIFKDGDELGVSMPKVLDAPYAVKLSTFAEDYKKSALCKMMGGETVSDEELNEVTEILSAFGEYMKGAMTLSENKEFMTQMEALQAELIKNAEIKENGKQTLNLSNGKEKECTVYSGTLTGQELLDFVSKEMDAIMSLDFAKNYFDVIEKQTGTSMQDMMDELKNSEDLDENVTVDVDFLVDDSYFRGLTLKLNGDDLEEGSFTVAYTGEEYLMDGLTFDLNVKDSYDQLGMKIAFTQNLGEKSNVYTQHLDCNIEQDETSLGSVTYDYKYDTKAKENNLDVSFGFDFGTEAKADFTAKGTKTVNKDEVSTNLSQAKLSADVDYESFGLEFNCGYGVKAVKASDITVDKTGVKYILEMSESELASAIQNIQSNIQAFAYGLL